MIKKYMYIHCMSK